MTLESLKAHLEAKEIGRPNLPNFEANQRQATLGNWQSLQPFQPSPEHLFANRIHSAAASPQGTPFDMLRTRIMRLAAAKGWRRIAVTSPTPSCGRSTVALNLAFGIARQTQTRVISIETDFRRPAHAGLIGLPPVKLSTAYLYGGEARFSDCAVLTRPNLAFATAGGPTPDAADILLGSNVSAALTEIDMDYAADILLFDTPPLLAHDDTLAFLKHVDCALIVAAADQTTSSELDECERLVAGETDVLGVVLNKCR